ncbi:hypothetical protein LINPERHAP2_LOCUS29884, partial [Linum perenne]
KYANFSAGDPIQVNGKQAWSPFSRFEVRPSVNHPTMVHLRSSYNNKFLQLNPDNDFIYPSSISPIEDQTKVASTLFIPEFSATDGTFSLLLVPRGLYVKCYNNGSVYCLRAISPTSTDPNCIFKFTDWQSLVTLPKHLSFKGDNGSYLGLLPESGAAVRFQIDDTANKTIAHELVALPDGTHSSALKLGPTVTIQPDQIPVITNSSKIAMSDPFQKSYVWGEPTTQNSDQYKHHSITLPPWTMVTVQLKANIATCYAPFAYTRHDVLDEVTGQQPETHVMDDGDYYCTNYFDFTFHDSDPQPITKKN